MKVTVYPGKVSGKVTAPPSKSMAHRLIICAAFAKGKSVIKNVSMCEDVLATLDCISALGVKYEISGTTVTIEGINIKNAKALSSLPCRQSGSTLRFMIPICLICGQNIMLTGDTSLLKRPLSVYEQLAKEKGFSFSQDETSVFVRGPLESGEYKTAGNISSQFISGLLFALPMLEKDSRISIIPPIESRSYIELTIAALKEFGITVTWEDENTLYIPGSQSYKPTDTAVEGDYSGAAFFEALNFLGGDVEVCGLREDSIQGDRVYKKLYPLLKKGTPTIHIGDCPDLGPILFAVAAAKYGGIFTGTRRLKIKESNRAEVMAKELEKFGVSVKVMDDTVMVYPCGFHAPKEILYGHDDHRIVMSLAVLLTVTGGTIDGAEAVAKSFPDFFDKLNALSEKETMIE
ncbi:MAG: 3-phosphoshikimate 1-carboxyvinyltransferase [Ruminococcaceae bacterium]|nr:3-phosphoshikimate 1-carboxyvinyltransferase [Oscillospiraceae bacterium]